MWWGPIVNGTGTWVISAFLQPPVHWQCSGAGRGTRLQVTEAARNGAVYSPGIGQVWHHQRPQIDDGQVSELLVEV